MAKRQKVSTLTYGIFTLGNLLTWRKQNHFVFVVSISIARLILNIFMWSGLLMSALRLCVHVAYVFIRHVCAEERERERLGWLRNKPWDS